MSRDIVIGDIHGCYDELLQLCEKVALSEEDRLISVGDLVDRGPRSLEVCDFFRERRGAVVLMGNHERKHVRGVRTYAQEIVRLQMGDRYDETVAWMRGLPYYLETDAALIVHASFENGVAIADQREDVLAGTTSGERYLETLYDGYWTDAYDGDRPIVFGHHVVGDDVKTWKGRVWGIDTGACHGGRLTALVLPDFEIVQVDAPRDYWAEEKRAWQAPVLAAKPWAELSFEQIDRELGRADRREGEGVAGVTAAIREWLAELDGTRDAIATAIDQTVAGLLADHGEDGFGRAAAAHPAKGWLFRHRRDPVDAGAVGTSCTSPAKLVELAIDLGLDARTAPRFD